MKPFGNYKSNSSLKTYFDANVIEYYTLLDITNSGLEGKIVNCEIVDEEYPEFTEVKIPHRRQSTFRLLKHEENGFLGNGWKDQSTRWNQLRFQNEVFHNYELIKNDGLSTLEFIEHSKFHHSNKIMHVNVGI
jgi:hypothetical protein